MSSSTAVPASGFRQIVAPFRHRAYRCLALALVLTTFASGVWAVALVWEVIRFGGGTGELSIVAASGAAGVILPALIGGVLADRLPKRSILLAVAALQAVGMGSGVLLSHLDRNGVAVFSVLSFVLGVGMAFYYPAYSAWLPALVPASDLQAVNGFEGMVRPGVQQAIGPAVAGAAVATAAPSAAMAIAAASSALAFLALRTVPDRGSRPVVPQDGPEAIRPSVLTDLREGVTYLFRTPWLLATLLFASLMILDMIGPMEVLLPFLVKDNLGGGPRDHSYVLAAFGIGGAVGSFVMGSIRMPRRYLTWMNLMWGVGCLPFVVIGTTRHIKVVILCGLVMGALFSAPMVIWGTLLQRRVPPHLLGRVASLDFFVSISLMPVSMALAAPFAAWLGLANSFILAGVAPILLALFAIVVWRLPADEVANPLDAAPAASHPSVTDPSAG